MYLNTLSKTCENILAFLLNNLGAEFSIMELAKAVHQDYKIVFTTVHDLHKEKLIIIKRISNINRCQLVLSKENAPIFAYVSERFSAGKLPARISHALGDMISAAGNPFYALLVFGSYAKGAARSASDVDLLFIVEDHEQEQEILAAVRKSATLNNLKINPVVLTLIEFKSSMNKPSVAAEVYKKHFMVRGGELFYSLISNA